MIFNKWERFLDPKIELRLIELAGRGKRMHETLYKDIGAAIADIYHLLKEEIEKSPYALFGHSMGCRISYDLAQKIRAENLPQPLHMFFSGRGAPHVKRDDEKIYHLMTDDDFKREILELGGTPPEFFEHRELLELFLPLLKSDFRIAEMEPPSREIHPLDSDITVFLGKDDDLNAEECDGWKVHTKQLCSIHHFEGGHFFLNDEAERIVNFINNTLLQTQSYKVGNPEINVNR
jgi:medium-chain acyl-[acyl-carrier-protein] hydrolase